ncbi:MAG: exodeoxyribonuclease VII small subunit [Oscillospiraceae bacterium]|nr:exodeoxyribonuclease VII small subunit [Oscillospiraceae bacterium]
MEQSKTFEASLSRLEEIVKLMERGDAPLDQALSLFEEGTALIRTCSTMLDNAELKVVRLMKGSDGTPVETDFAGEEA